MDRPLPKQKYRHFKGSVYIILALATNSEKPEEELVIYRSEQTGVVWARPLAMWNQYVKHEGFTVPRFNKIED